MDEVRTRANTSVLIDTYVSYNGRYGLARPTINVADERGSDQPWAYTPLEGSQAAATTPSEDTLPMKTYPSSTVPTAAPHVLFDQDDPFEDSV